MIRKIRYIIFTFFVLIAIILILCFVKLSNNKDSNEVQYVIGMSQANLTEPWRISMNQDILNEAKSYKNINVVYRDAGGDTEKQKKDIDELLASGVDLLIVSMNDSEKLTPEVSKAYKSIPVIVLDRAVQGYDYSLYIGPDNESIGRQVGKYIADLIGNGKGKILEVQGLLNSHPVVERSKGLRDVINDYSNIEISRTIIGEWQRDESEDKVKEILQQDKDINIIFAHNDYMAYGAYKAVHDMGLNNIKIIGIDGLVGENGGLDLVSKGMMQGTFTCPTGGKEAIDYALDILNKKSDIPKKVILRSDKITSSNVNGYLNNKLKRTKEHKNIVLGYAQLKSESKWREVNAKSITDAAEKAGVNLVFLEEGSTQEDEKRMIRELIKRKVDVISFSPYVKSGWDDVLKEAKAANIPVIISDRNVDSDDSLWINNIGSDFYEEGRRAARLLVDLFKDKKKVNILELKGNEGAAPTIDRTDGFMEIIKDYNNYNIIDSYYGNFEYKDGKNVVKNYIKKNPSKVNVIYAQNDDMALGAIDAIKELGLIPGKDIIVVGTDGTKEALVSIKNGEMYGTVECNPLLGVQLIRTAIQVVDGYEVPLRIVNSEDIFTKGVTYKQIFAREY